MDKDNVGWDMYDVLKASIDFMEGLQPDPSNRDFWEEERIEIIREGNKALKRAIEIYETTDFKGYSKRDLIDYIGQLRMDITYSTEKEIELNRTADGIEHAVEALKHIQDRLRDKEF